MGECMSDQGVGLQLLALACSIGVAGICACNTGHRDGAGAAEQRGAAQSRVPAGEGAPVPRATEQVVQRMVAAPDRSASSGAKPAAGTAAPSPKGRTESITSRHLEAELNRLEAELGR